MIQRPYSQPEVKPEVALLEDLFAQIERGKLRCPRFQRPFVWKPTQMLELFDSVERGYPVGTLLLWEPENQVPSLDRMGALSVPRAPKSGVVAYLLDGHQRLSTLYSVLRLPSNFPRSTRQDDWQWWIYRDLRISDPKKNGFLHVPREKPDVALMPLRAIMKTMDYLGFARDLTEHHGKKDTNHRDIKQWIERSELLANHFKSYRLATIRILGGTVEQAVEIFSRLNSKGRRITPDQMFSALIYPSANIDGDGGDATLADAIDRILERLSELDFGAIQRTVVFRTVLAAAGEEDLQRTDWERVARTIGDTPNDGDSEGTGIQASIEKAKIALVNAVRFLKRNAGVCHWRLLPYANQLVLLAAFFIDRPRPSPAQKEELVRWFWTTSLSGWFAGANTTQLKNALIRIKSFAGGSASDLMSEFPGDARPYPTTFDMQGARVRTLLLWQLRARPLDSKGKRLRPERELATHSNRAYRHIKTAKAEWSSDPANRIMLPPDAGKSVRQTLLDLTDSVRDRVLESHHIPSKAYEALKEDDYERFITLRAQHMAEQERDFIRGLGLTPAAQTTGETDLDSDADEDGDSDG